MPAPRRPHADAADALIGVAPLAARWIERTLSGHHPPLTVQQFLALRAISRERLTSAELARRAAVSGPAISQLLTSLAAAGLIERQADPADRRHYRLALSPQGDAVYRSAHALLRERVGALLAELPRPEADALAALLARIEMTLTGTPPPRRHPRPPPHPRP